MKTVFGNRELAHIWAQQNQDHGRNSSDTMFFNGDSIYSYGHHYLMAKFHGDIVLINSDGYSSSTGKQRGHVSSAVSDRTSFYVPDPSGPKCSKNIDYLDQNIWNAFNGLIMSNKGAKFNVNSLMRSIDERAEYFKAFNIKNNLVIDTDIVNEILAYKDHRQQLRENDPNRDIKKEKARLARIELLERKVNSDKIKVLVMVKEWKRGGSSNGCFFNRMPTFLRIKGSSVETSKGATVPLVNAIELYKLIKANVAIDGDRIGHYTFNNFDGENIKIGCHNIAIKEADRVLGQYLLKEAV